MVAVAGATELGRLGASLASVQPPPTPLQRQTRRLTSRLSIWALGLCVTLALLPNEIPVVLALFLALGALRLARMGVLARWPAAVESLGSATVLAVDKTGTLTENRMGVHQLLTWPVQELWQRG